MTKEEYEFVKEVYEEIVIKQILDTIKLKAAANIILGKEKDELIAVNRARQIIYNFCNYQAKEFLDEFESTLDDKYVDKTETQEGDPRTMSQSQEGQSHSEEQNDEIPNQSDEELPNQSDEDDEIISETELELERLQKEYDKEEDTNKRRSLKMKINHLNKRS